MWNYQRANSIVQQIYKLLLWPYIHGISQIILYTFNLCFLGKIRTDNGRIGSWRLFIWLLFQIQRIKCVIAACDTEVYWGPLEPWQEKNELSLSPNLPNSSLHSQRCLPLHFYLWLRLTDGWSFWFDWLNHSLLSRLQCWTGCPRSICGSLAMCRYGMM